MMPNWVMDIFAAAGRLFGRHVHEWEKLPDHPMHHKCKECGEEIWDWVW